MSDKKNKIIITIIICSLLVAAIAFLLIFKFHSNDKSALLDLKNVNPDSFGAGYAVNYGMNDDSLDYYTAVVDKKTKLDEYWKLDYINEWYKKRVNPPAFDFNVDLTKLSAVQLRFLRNEIYARNGYCFQNHMMRGYFLKYPWYQPLWDIKDFKIELTRQEKNFIDKTIELEKELQKNRIISLNGNNLINYDFVINKEQFTSIPDLMVQSLRSKNFAIVPSKEDQLFYIYDKNCYDYTPNFITTDLYLQTLHMHFSRLLQNIEKTYFIGLMKNLLNNMYSATGNLYKSAQQKDVKSGAAWANTYYAIAYSLINGQRCNVPAEYKSVYNYEMSNLESAQGVNSKLLDYKLYDYSAVKPRGNYADSVNLRQYFKSVKWLMTAPIVFDNNNAFIGAIVSAHTLLNSDVDLKSYYAFNNTINFIAGDENNLSLLHLINILKNDYSGKSIKEIITPSNLEKIKKQLLAVNPRKMKQVAGNIFAKEQFDRPYLLFTAGRYTFDGDILSRLVHLRDKGNERPIPKSLDIFAVEGNAAAENILINTFNENIGWKQYSDTLNFLKNKFKDKNDWDKNSYNKTMQTILSIGWKQTDYPLFMQTDFWDRKNLNTSLAAWTELKHDMVLYSEQPVAAEAGGGEDGPPPPIHLSYVEPNINFWSKAIELLSLEEKILSENNLLSAEIKEINQQLIEIAQNLLAISQKELKGEKITNIEFGKLNGIGGSFEYLTLKILDNDHIPDRDKQISLITDVYAYNDSLFVNRKLNEAVGLGDEIYVVTQINGLPYITKGAVFSYYEFIDSDRYTDEEWQARISRNNLPKRPVWMNDLIVPVKSLKTKKEFGFD